MGARTAALVSVVVLAGTAAAADAPSPAPLARTHLMPGELTRVDLTRRALVVKTDGKDAREVETVTTAQTRLTSGGRVIRLEDMRPGDRVAVTCADEGGRHQARAVRVLPRASSPRPSPSVAPSVAPSSGPGLID